MKITGNIDKVAWTLLDKGTFVLFAIAVIKIIMSSISVSDWGVFSQLISINTFIFVIIDSLALQSVIQYGQEEKTAPFVNTISMSILLSLALLISIPASIFKEEIAWVMQEDRYITILSLLPLMIFSMIPRFFSIKFLYRDLEYKKLFFTNLSYFGAITISIVAIKTSVFSDLSAIFNDNILFDIDSLFDIYLYSALFSSLIGYLFTYKSWKFSLIKSIPIKTILNFNTPIAISSILHSVPKLLDTLIIQFTLGGNIGAQVAGIYSGAKILMRGFEDLTSAIYGIIYPLSRKYIARGELDNAKVLITKAISYMFLFFIVISIVLYSGVLDTLINVILPAKYKIESNLIDILTSFKILVIAGIALPFTTIAGLINADEKPIVVAKITGVSVTLSSLLFLILGYLGFTQLIPLGLVMFYVSIALSYIFYARKYYDIQLKEYLRALHDTSSFIKNKSHL